MTPWHSPSLVVLVLFAARCTVPTLPELELSAPRACTSTRPCLAGYDCVAGLCQPKETCTGSATRACGSSVGACRPGTQTCAEGFWGPCDGATGPAPERCDGVDNDCNGTPDDPLAIDVSRGGELGGRNAVAAPISDGGVLVLYELGTHVVASVVHGDDSIEPAVAPAVTLDLASQSDSAALAHDGQLIAGAWQETVGGEQRVMLATLDERGRSTVRSLATGAPAQAMVVFAPRALSALKLSVDSLGAQIVLGAVDDGVLVLVRTSTMLPASPTFSIFGDAGVAASDVSVAAASAGAFWVGWSTAAGDATRCLLPPDAGLVCASPVRARAVTMHARSASSALSYLAGVDGLQASLCQLGTFDGGALVTCAAAARLAGLDAGAPASAPGVASLGARHVLVFQGGEAPPIVRLGVLDPAPAVVRQLDVASGVRPAVSVSAAGVCVAYDTADLRLDAGAGAVFVRRVCGAQ